MLYLIRRGMKRTAGGRVLARRVTEVSYTIQLVIDGEAFDRGIVRAVRDELLGEWVVMPGIFTGKIDVGETRARAEALISAADECDRRNETEGRS